MKTGGKRGADAASRAPDVGNPIGSYEIIQRMIQGSIDPIGFLVVILILRVHCFVFMFVCCFRIRTRVPTHTRF
jgi:Na+/melibiose symporter-like transporter